MKMMTQDADDEDKDKDYDTDKDKDKDAGRHIWIIADISYETA